MQVQPHIQAKLLDLAAIDTELKQLAHRRTHLPEQQEFERLEKEMITRKDAAVAAQIAVDDLDRDIAKLEKDVDQIRQREEKDRAMLLAGKVSAKQLGDLQHELGSLERRQRMLEDELLEVMEQREAAQGNYEHAGANLSRAEDELIDVRRRRDDALADIDATEQARVAARAEFIAQFPADVVAVYERARESSGVGAALLQARRCGGCRIELDRSELNRIAATPAESVVECQECETILVRTKESGL